MINRERPGTAPLASNFLRFSDLAAWRIEGVDFTVSVAERPASRTAVIAPHGGSIEQYSSEVARLTAGEDLNLYLLEGKMRGGNYSALHLTSHRFDEPRCLALLARCDCSVAIHGCAGNDAIALIGGLDEELKVKLLASVAAAGIKCRVDDDQFRPASPRISASPKARLPRDALKVTRAFAIAVLTQPRSHAGTGAVSP